jgi:hypothetical protein
MFVYLTDVNEGGGPLFYAPATHGLGRVKSRPKAFKEEGSGATRSTDEQMCVVVPKERWITAIGSKGTVVFADTRGYHKGGLARECDRIVYTCMFTSQASTALEYIERKLPMPTYSDQAMAFALDGR